MSARHKIGLRSILAPVALIAKKQRVGQEDRDKIELPLLIHLDAAKRGQGPNVGQQFLYQHLVIASYIAARTKSKPFHDAVVKANDALSKASLRPTVALDLTTGEYAAIRLAFAIYLRALPQVEIGVMDEACKAAERLMAA